MESLDKLMRRAIEVRPICVSATAMKAKCLMRMAEQICQIEKYCNESLPLTQCRDWKMYTEDWVLYRVKGAYHWRIAKWEKALVKHLIDNGAKIIVFGKHGFASHKCAKPINIDGMNRKKLFNECKGERMRKKPQTSGSRLPYQRVKASSEVFRPSNWGIIIAQASINVTK